MITLTGYDQVAVIDKQGAVVMSYAWQGVDVLYPRQQIDGSWRGGSHVCAPNFGPGGASDQPQHGFARTVTWRVVASSDTEAVLSYTQTSGTYAGLQLTITYRLAADGFEMEVVAHNQSSQPLRYAPGWHPYFAVSQGECLVDGDVRRTGDYLEMELYQPEVATEGSCCVAVQSDKIFYNLITDGLTQFAIWSGHPDRYLCIEPTAEGNGFSDLPLQSGYRLATDEIVRHCCKIAPVQSVA